MPEKIEELINGCKIIQEEYGQKFGTDAVQLANFVKIRKGERIADLCSGTGIIPIYLCALNSGITVDAVEISGESAELARRSAALNGLEDKINIITGDIRDIKTLLPASSTDVVTVNPPYLRANSGKISGDGIRAAARHEILCGLGDVIGAAEWLLRHGGRFYMVHRPERMGDIFYEMRAHKIEPKILRMIYKDIKSAPSLILIGAQKGAATGLIVQPPHLLT